MYSNQDTAAIAVISLLVISLVIATAVLMIISVWKLFTKAGEPGWKSIIPVYGGYVWYQLTWTPGWFILLVVVSSVMQFFSEAPVLLIIASLVMFGVQIGLSINIAKSYGKGGGYAAGLLLLPILFYPMLAFGNSTYVGPRGESSPYSNSYETTFASGGEPAQNDAASGDPFEKPASEEPGSNRKVWIAVAILGALALILVGSRLWMSLTKVNMIKGLAHSPFVGLANYQRLLSTPALSRALLSTFLMRVVDILLAVGFGFIGAAAGKGRGRGIVAGIGLALAAIPSLLWEILIIRGRLLASSAGVILIYLQHALPWAGLSMFAGALLVRTARGRTSSAALTVPELMLFTFFTGVFMPNSLAVTPINMHSAPVDSVIYRYGFQNAQIAAAAATEVLRGALTLVFAVVGALVMIPLLRSYASDNRPATAGASSGALPAGLIAGLSLLTIGVLSILGGSGIPSEDIARSAGGSVALMLVTLVLGFGIYFLLYLLVGDFRREAPFPLALCILFAMALGTFSICQYMTAHSLHLVNTVLPVAMRAVLNPLTLTFAFVLALLRPRRMSARLLLALSAAAFAATFSLGNYSDSLIYLSRIADLGSMIRYVVGSVDWFSTNLLFVPGLILLLGAVPALVSGLLALKVSSRD